MRESFESGIVLRQKINSLRKEIFRKSIHLCSAFVPLLLHYAYWLTVALLVLAVILYSVCEFLRLHGHKIPLVSVITETAARKRDENKFVLGPVTLVFGILAAALFLPPQSARIGIFALSFGDGCASLVGKVIGRVKIPLTKGKTLEGSLACFLAVFVSTLCCTKSPLVSFIIALCAMLIEMLPLADFDNLLIPFAIGLIHWLLVFCGL